MTIFSRILGAVFALVLGATAANAQFTAQATFAGTAGGTANALALTVPNWTKNLAGVPLTFIPSADNTGATTVQVSGVASPIPLLKPANPGLAALSGGEVRNGQLTTVVFDGTSFILQGQLGKSVLASSLSASALSFETATNLALVASVNTNALTIAVKTAAGADPAADTPVLVPFRNNTIANGDPKIVAITGALSLTINSGNTMGCASAQYCRLWIVAICASGLDCANSPGTNTVGLCAFNARNGVSIAPINEAQLQTSASGTNGGNSAQTYYCNISSVTARAVRILGYVDILETVAGTWASGPTFTQLFGPGIKRPGDTVQIQSFELGTILSQTGVIPLDDSIPQINEGAEYLSVSIVPSAAANMIQVTARAAVASAASANMSGALFRDSGVNALAAVNNFTAAQNQMGTILIVKSVLANSTASTTFSLRLGPNGAGNTTMNGSNVGQQYYGGVSNSFMLAREIMG